MQTYILTTTHMIKHVEKLGEVPLLVEHFKYWNLKTSEQQLLII